MRTGPAVDDLVVSVRSRQGGDSRRSDDITDDRPECRRASSGTSARVLAVRSPRAGLRRAARPTPTPTRRGALARRLLRPAAAAPSRDTAPTTPVDPDRELAEAALLAPDDLEGDWRAPARRATVRTPPRLARTAPACVPFADLVFEGGAQHGAGSHRRRCSGRRVSSTPTSSSSRPAEEAATMMSAVDVAGVRRLLVAVHEQLL